MRLALATAASALLIGAPLVGFAGPPVDTDSDGVPDLVDNCSYIENAPNCDTDQDGYGNACDGDFNNDGAVDFSDLPRFVPDYYDPTTNTFPLGPGWPTVVSPCGGFDCVPASLPGVTNVELDGTNMDCSPDGPTGDWKDGSVNAADFDLFTDQLGLGAPGPSGLPCQGTPPCCVGGSC